MDDVQDKPMTWPERLYLYSAFAIPATLAYEGFDPAPWIALFTYL